MLFNDHFFAISPEHMASERSVTQRKRLAEIIRQSGVFMRGLWIHAENERLLNIAVCISHEETSQSFVLSFFVFSRIVEFQAEGN